MIIDHNIDDLRKKLKNLSVLERCKYIDRLKDGNPHIKRMETRLEYNNKERLKMTKPKIFCPFLKID